MIRRFLLVAAVLLSGCLGPVEDDSMANECAIEGLFLVKSEKKISCRNMSVDVALARDMMIERGWFQDVASWNKAYAEVQIEIVDRKCISGPSIFQWIPLKGCLYGLYYENEANPALRNPRVVTFLPKAIIELNWDGMALAHEFMHHYDHTTGRDESMAQPHDGWEALGYYRFADDHKASALPLN
jgi:hypothetical protein